MPKLDYEMLAKHINENVVTPFYAKRLKKLREIKLEDMLKRKNPYLFRAKNVQTAEELVKQILNASLSSSEETTFGNLLEKLAIHISERIYGGFKSSAKGIDLEFDKEGVRYLVAIKSGPNWGNASQIEKMKNNFSTAKRTLATSGGTRNVIAVNGCSYGKESVTEKLDYTKLCGQQYWEFISGDSELYLKMIEPLGKQAKAKDENFDEEYARKVNELSKELLNKFCVDGLIDWERLVRFNSEKA